LIARLQKFGIFYERKFDIGQASQKYEGKFGFDSSHRYALNRVQSGSTVIDFGCGPGYMSTALVEKGVKTISIDRSIQRVTRECSHACIEAEIAGGQAGP